jgi:hypothetical protein
MKHRSKTALRAFVRSLELMDAENRHAELREESTDELCRMNELASRGLKLDIQREIRNTDDL